MLKGLQSDITDLDEKGRIVVAANAFGNIDSDRDISMPGSFDKTIRENFTRLKWFLNHDRTQLLGVPLEATPTKEYLQVVGQINLDKQIGRDTYADYKLFADHGKSLEHSIGVDAIKYIEDRENNVRKVTEWKWWEYSTLTSWGANEKTPLISIKSASPAMALDLFELRMEKGNYSDETFIQIENSIKRLKSLMAVQKKAPQPVSADVLAGVSAQFLKSLTH
jgi:HK97 family phage prohead protease